MRVIKRLFIAVGLVVIAIFRGGNEDAHHPMRVDSWSNATLPGMDDTHSHADLDVLDSYYYPNGGYLGS
jgi:N-acyl-D-aspartate/D-glutamate deacylase